MNRFTRVIVVAVVALLSAWYGAPVSRATARQDLPEGRGKDVTQQLCDTSCHSVDRLVTHRASKNEWLDIVADMQGRGATGSDEGFKAVVSYLTAHFGKPIKINEAGSADLDGTLDLGPGQADAIVTYRGAHGAFADWNALLKVPGLDAASLEEQRANILF
jgi:competence ComEA-like helix-hairpin-helix protein